MVDAKQVMVAIKAIVDTSQIEKLRQGIGDVNHITNFLTSNLDALNQQLKSQTVDLTGLKNQLAYERAILQSRKDLTNQQKAEIQVGFRERARDAQEEVNITKEAIGSLEQKIRSIDKATQASKTYANQQQVQSNLDKRVKQLTNETRLTAEELAAGLGKVGLRFDKNANLVNKFNQVVVASNASLKDHQKVMMQVVQGGINQMIFAYRGLQRAAFSVIVIGMMLQRTSMQAFRAMTTTFQKANEETQGLGKATWHLQAAWEFFKYSLIDALMQSAIFQWVIEMLFKIVKWFAELPQYVKVWIAIGLGVMFVVGSLLLLVGQLIFAIVGLKMLSITAAGAKTSMGLLGGISLSPLLAALAKFAFWGIIIYLAWRAIDSVFEVINETYGTNISLMRIMVFLLRAIRVGSSLLAQGFVAAVLIMLAGVSWIVAGFGMILHWIWKFPDIFMYVWKLVANGMYSVLGDVFNWAIQKVQNIIDGINAASRWLGFGNVIPNLEKIQKKPLIAIDKSAMDLLNEPTWFSKLAIGADDLAKGFIDKVEQIGIKAIMDTPTIGEMWNGKEIMDSNNDLTNSIMDLDKTFQGANRDLDLSGTTQSVVNQINVGDIVTTFNESSATVGDQLDEISDAIIDRVMQDMNDEFQRKLGSTTR